jgi:uncharacterized membrane protein YphA (DoxX/SURF4 family)
MTTTSIGSKWSSLEPKLRSLLRIVAAFMFMLLVGLCTRPVAFVLAGEMAVAFFQFHFPKSIWPTVNGGVSAVLYCFLWLYFSAAGPGPLSLDAIRQRTHDIS